ncbi:hypothetical protein GM415_09110 [Pseudodesulfovibrio cashew]|uniref:Mpv17/PMP22 family protein n=1 Tax=Pseudodesulfovibrio cashew TaxID=2678688 RepID=A0A6I6JBX4_9BACT|nr:Mpv17/PMP22 family protein [Pseudodesulfovibrio cashew]QGY40276.1 hypothetical protein GM415_09110 [Pseudodesulfovibrio cashew]
MKLSDAIVSLAVLAAIGIYFFVPAITEPLGQFSVAHPFIMSFMKFAVLCTLGETLGLRITDKRYVRPGFGLAPRFLVWGFIGIVIHVAFVIFATGTPLVLGQLFSMDLTAEPSFGTQLGIAFSISTLNNLLFAPLFMIAHGVANMHISETGGSFGRFFSAPDISGLLRQMNWDQLWGFVFKKTIPFFWIPAHTITFMLPPEARVLFAAALGVVLGIVLALASLKQRAAVQEPA